MAAADTINSLYRGPSGEMSAAAREWAPDYPIFKQVGRTGASRYTPSIRDDRHGRVFIYSPDAITFQEYDEMRMDGQVRAGLSLIKLPIIQSNWTVACEDDDITAFCNQVLKPIWPDFIRQMLLALDFGYSLFEKIWRFQYDLTVTQTQAQAGGAKTRHYPKVVTLEDFMHLDPNTLYLLAYRWSGDFAGAKQYVGSSAVVPVNKCVLFANDVEYKEWYGVARTKPCYPYWAFKKYMYEWTNVFYETYSVPMKKGRYPEGVTEMGVDSNNQPILVQNSDYMMNILEEMRNNHAVALPSSRYEESTVYKWEIEPWESNRTGADHLAYIDHLNLMILKSLLVPQLALEVGGTGSYALAQTQVDFFFTGEQALMKQVESVVTNQVLKQLVRYNFGPHAPQAIFKFQPLAADLRQGLENMIMETLGSGHPVPMKDGSALTPDWQWLAESLGIPLQTLSPEEYEKMQQQAQPQVPQGQDGDPSQYGGQDHQYGSTSQGAQPTASGTMGDNTTSDQPVPENSDTNLNEYWQVVDGELVVRLSE